MRLRMFWRVLAFGNGSRRWMTEWWRPFWPRCERGPDFSPLCRDAFHSHVIRKTSPS